MQPDQRRGRLQPELLVQRAAVDLEGLQGLGLPAGPVPGQDQSRPEPVPVRVLPDQRLQVRQRLQVLPLCDQRVGERLAGAEPQLLEPCRLGLRGVVVGEVQVGSAAPERQRPPQVRDRTAVSGAVLGLRAATARTAARPPLRPRPPAGSRCRRWRAGRPSRRAPGGDATGETCECSVATVVVVRWSSPQHLDEPVGRDSAVGVQDQRGEQATLLGTEHRRLGTQLQRPEDGDVARCRHHQPPRLLTCRRHRTQRPDRAGSNRQRPGHAHGVTGAHPRTRSAESSGSDLQHHVHRRLGHPTNAAEPRLGQDRGQRPRPRLGAESGARSLGQRVRDAHQGRVRRVGPGHRVPQQPRRRRRRPAARRASPCPRRAGGDGPGGRPRAGHRGRGSSRRR